MGMKIAEAIVDDIIADLKIRAEDDFIIDPYYEDIEKEVRDAWISIVQRHLGAE